MSLNYRYVDIDDYVGLHSDPDELVKSDAIVYLTMTIGIRKLTEKNIEEVIRRVMLVEEAYGATVRSREGPVYLTPEDLRRRIGLATNASEKTKAKFDNEIRRELFRQASASAEYRRAKSEQKARDASLTK